ncbi:glycosyltransferase family 2 protein [Inhella proteolytica]|uniref:Glycosyltransferase n=1 Tax=Inhella proteolytica TaxID=2795029 RepID=A0A931J1N4_9BURK|nr:glycosyltransferase family 2 protein [Inhella proteolytica]MBH9576505.1 glycosyltransferase [Inhella proteolytica]
MIGVVIPYFQREPGVLRRAVASVIAQRDVQLPVHLCIVDDSSPLPAHQELAGLESGGVDVNVVVQPNGGPGAARNRGLDSLPSSCEFVAFLDSDDEWAPDHLARAMLALASGANVYFSNFYQLGQTVGAFERAGRLVANRHPTIDGAPGLHQYTGDMFDQVLRGNVIGTPTIVYRRARFENLRFRNDLARAGEDYLFWMAMAHAGARFAFSTQIEAVCGRGVNVYSGVEWATDAFFVRVRNELSYRKATRRLYALNPEQQAHVRRCIRQLRRDFALALLSRLRKGPRLPSGLLAAQWREDAGSLLLLPLALLPVH